MAVDLEKMPLPLCRQGFGVTIAAQPPGQANPYPGLDGWHPRKAVARPPEDGPCQLERLWIEMPKGERHADC